MRTPVTYADAGVDITAGNTLVERIKPMAAQTNRAGSMSSLGGFGALFDLKGAGYDDPVLISATDGVGTKLRLAIECDALDTIGVDLVAMCVNDLICQGAEPLFFLDYFATGHLDVDQATRIISGIAAGCAQTNTALIGGETAEMPGLYAKDDFDLAGFAVGAAPRDGLLPQVSAERDILIGLASTGVHSNGYSLIRKLIEIEELSLDAPAPFDPKQTLKTALLAPTALYVRALLPLIRTHKIKAAAHITGGGLTENIPRVLSKGMGADINLSSWKLPPVFAWAKKAAGLPDAEMLRTFNCGIGMAVITSPDNAVEICSALSEFDAKPIGEITHHPEIRYIGQWG